MKKLMVCWLLATSASAQEIPLEIKGDVQIVKVDKVIIVKEDRTVVKTLPFTVQAPVGAGLYFWAYPTGVSATDRGDQLIVTVAAKGPMTVSVKLISANVDKDGKFVGFITKFGSTSFDVGDVAPPPAPVSELQKKLQAAYDAEVGADKFAQSQKLADLLAAVVPQVRASGKVTTVKQFNDTVHIATETLMPGAIMQVRKAVSTYLVTQLPTLASTPTDAAYWDKAAVAYATVAGALKGVR